MAFTVPNLPYPTAALEPHIDSRTMEIHHGKHHAAYVAKLNAALENTPYAAWPLEKILRDIKSLPENIRTAVQNNGGGHANHSLFWTVMSPQGGGKPSGEIAKAIDANLGGFEEFKNTFSQAAANRFGSGWAWLVLNQAGKVEVYSTANQDSPLMKGDTPLLGLDVWEHAYYLHYQNRRPDYIEAFFNVINWKQVEANYLAAR